MMYRGEEVVVPSPRPVSVTAEIVVIGLNHRTSPIGVRERVALSPDRRDDALRILRDESIECVIVSTCNRVELYAVVNTGPPGVDRIADFFARFHGLDPLE